MKCGGRAFRWAIFGGVLSLVLARPLAAMAQSTGEQEFRRATSTLLGDTGLWFLPTAEVIRPRHAGVVFSRINLDFRPGSTDVSHFGAGGTVAVTRRMEVFGVWRLDTRIDRDENPLFSSGPLGGIVNDYPLVSQPWSEGRGDTVVGAKFNLRSQADGRPLAIAVRSFVKLPTGSADVGVSTGKPDLSVNVIFSQEASSLAYEWTLVGGYTARGNPDGIIISDGVTWGAGFAIPSRRAYRLVIEAHGEWYLDSQAVVIVNHPPPALASLTVPAGNPQSSPVNVNIGFDWLARHGIFVSGAVQLNLNQPGVNFGSKVGFQGRIGYHPGVLLPKPVDRSGRPH